MFFLVIVTATYPQDIWQSSFLKSYLSTILNLHRMVVKQSHLPSVNMFDNTPFHTEWLTVLFHQSNSICQIIYWIFLIYLNPVYLTIHHGVILWGSIWFNSLSPPCRINQVMYEVFYTLHSSSNRCDLPLILRRMTYMATLISLRICMWLHRFCCLLHRIVNCHQYRVNAVK